MFRVSSNDLLTTHVWHVWDYICLGFDDIFSSGGRTNDLIVGVIRFDRLPKTGRIRNDEAKNRQFFCIVHGVLDFG